MSIDAVLSRLHKVKQTGLDSWVACCPSHADRQPSLSIRELDDGRILLHDFGGCCTEEILDSIGLAFDDLFAQPLAHHKEPLRHRWPARDVLECVANEVMIVALVAQAVTDGKLIPPDDMKRCHVANRRLNEALEAVRGS